jgi:hypothetical protein
MVLRVGAPVFAGVGFLIFALVLWVWGQRRRSLALRSARKAWRKRNELPNWKPSWPDSSSRMSGRWQ